MLTYGDDGRARWWDSASGALLLDVAIGEGTGPLADLTGDGARFAVGLGQTAGVWDGRTGERLLERTLESPVWALALDRDGGVVVIATQDGVVRAWDVASGALRYQLTASAPVSPTGK